MFLRGFCKIPAGTGISPGVSESSHKQPVQEAEGLRLWRLLHPGDNTLTGQGPRAKSSPGGAAPHSQAVTVSPAALITSQAQAARLAGEALEAITPDLGQCQIWTEALTHR